MKTASEEWQVSYTRRAWTRKLFPNVRIFQSKRQALRFVARLHDCTANGLSEPLVKIRRREVGEWIEEEGEE